MPLAIEASGMCGRYSLFAPPDEIEERFDATFDFAFEPRYNAAPSQELPVVTGDEPETIQRMEWGLVPSWADDRSEYEFINARAETIRQKSSFSDAYERRRCLVPADGFYEWAETSGGKEPYRITLADESVFGMAGLWERWEPPQRQTGLGEFGGGAVDGDPEPVETFTIVTTEPNDFFADYHDRMAVVLDREAGERWLSAEDPSDLLAPSGLDLQAWPVSRAVNDPSNDRPDLVEPVG